jgi:hypothetical protein
MRKYIIVMDELGRIWNKTVVGYFKQAYYPSK